MTSGDPIFDGEAQYRTDQFGARIVVLPAVCRHRHNLGAAGYRAQEAGGVLRVRCALCTSLGAPDPAWTLRTTGPAADRAELDNTPYQTLVPRLSTVQTAVEVTFRGLIVRWYLDLDQTRLVATATRDDVTWTEDASETVRRMANWTRDMLRAGNNTTVKAMATARLTEDRQLRMSARRWWKG